MNHSRISKHTQSHLPKDKSNYEGKRKEQSVVNSFFSRDSESAGSNRESTGNKTSSEENNANNFVSEDTACSSSDEVIFLLKKMHLLTKNAILNMLQHCQMWAC